MGRRIAAYVQMGLDPEDIVDALSEEEPQWLLERIVGAVRGQAAAFESKQQWAYANSSSRLADEIEASISRWVEPQQRGKRKP